MAVGIGLRDQVARLVVARTRSAGSSASTTAVSRPSGVVLVLVVIARLSRCGRSSVPRRRSVDRRRSFRRQGSCLGRAGPAVVVDEPRVCPERDRVAAIRRPPRRRSVVGLVCPDASRTSVCRRPPRRTRTPCDLPRSSISAIDLAGRVVLGLRARIVGRVVRRVVRDRSSRSSRPERVVLQFGDGGPARRSSAISRPAASYSVRVRGLSDRIVRRVVRIDRLDELAAVVVDELGAAAESVDLGDTVADRVVLGVRGRCRTGVVTRSSRDPRGRTRSWSPAFSDPSVVVHGSVSRSAGCRWRRK